MNTTPKLDSELTRAIKSHQQWFGSYTRSGELKKVQVWLTIKDGLIEFLTPGDSYKAKRVRRNPQVVCFLGSKDGPSVAGAAEIVTDPGALGNVYNRYWKSHPVMMVLLFATIRKRIKAGNQVVIRVRPNEPNPLAGITDPVT